jgi:N-acetylglucosamine kinase-like BadF-type ATPase
VGLSVADREVALDGVLAIDAGNSKTDVALIAADGSVRGSARGPGFRPHAVGAQAAVAGLEPILREAASVAGLDVDGVVGGRPWATQVSACLANADLPTELERIEREFDARGWGASTYIGNDTFALLRAGVEAPPGVAVVCGAGINCSGLLPDGRTARFAAVGKLSGDWGGGEFLAEEAMWWAARSEDGRGPQTTLARLLPAHFGCVDMAGLIEALHLGDIAAVRWHEMTPLLFAAAAAGDDVARSVVRRQADEIVALASSALRRLDLLDAPVDVILGGGVITAGHRLLLDAVDDGLSAVAPKAVARVVSTPPVVGAALLGLDQIDAGPGAHDRLRRAFGALSPTR